MKLFLINWKCLLFKNTFLCQTEYFRKKNKSYHKNSINFWFIIQIWKPILKNLKWSSCRKTYFLFLKRRWTDLAFNNVRLTNCIFSIFGHQLITKICLSIISFCNMHIVMFVTSIRIPSQGGGPSMFLGSLFSKIWWFLEKFSKN